MASHVHDDRLFDCYLAERSHEAPDPHLAEHLADCAECRVRYAALARFMDTLRTEADEETDEIFTPDRLRAQQLRVARRIEQGGRAARVLSFPRRLVSRHISATSGHRATRWVYAAAAAGLAIGIALGAIYDSQLRGTARAGQLSVGPRFSVPRPTRFTPVSPDRTTPAPDASDDLFLSELDMALERPRTRALQPFDALTPHVREVTDSVR